MAVVSNRVARSPRLVADIGGSNARFGWMAATGDAVMHVRKLPVCEFATPTLAVQTYLRELERELGSAYLAPRRAAFAVATAVGGDRVDLTNSRWSFSRAAVKSELELDEFVVLNDFEALAFSLPALKPAQLRVHGGVMPSATGTLAVIGPGTGLGVAGLVQTSHGWTVVPGEGGHASLSAADDFESELLKSVRREFPHVSAERLLSGIGLPTLFRAVADVSGKKAAPLTAEEIVDYGIARTDALCEQTIDIFCALLGSFAGNVALTLGARGGVYIGGGIVPRFGECFFESRFRERFEAKGRFQPYLAAIPTALITDTLAALSGAAVAIERQSA
jgi:glucokinase